MRNTVLDSRIVAGGDLSIQARNGASIEAENAATAAAAGTAVGATLAFNTIGWASQNVLFNALDALLGTSIGDEDPALVVASVLSSALQAGGALAVDARTRERVSAKILNEATSSDAGTGVGLVLASNMISARALAEIDAGDEGDAQVSISAGRTLSVTAEDEAQIEAEAEMVAGSGGGVAVGGLIVRNDVRSQVDARVERVQGSVVEDMLVLALESAGISARRPEISRSASAQREVESAIMDASMPMSRMYSAIVIPV